jgi:Ca-activated chloride channel family protein
MQDLRKPLVMLATTLAMLLTLRGTVSAQGILYPNDFAPETRTSRLGLPLPPRPIFVQPFYVKDLRVTTVINDAVAETTVSQTFVNSTSVAQEGTYLYPLPEGAMPTAFSMTIGDKTMEPRVLTAQEARSIYEGYVRRYRDPALLEYVGRNLVKISVYPIPPQSERIIKMRYTEVLKPQGGMRKYAYSLSTSRFSSRPVGVTTVSIKLMTSFPLKNVFSPSHDLSVRRPDDRNATASWEGVNDTSDRDLTLFYSTSADDVGLSLLTYRSGDRDGTFMLLASPRVQVPKERILPKQVVFVLDRTGSMSGKKIEQAQKSLLYCLGRLRPEDKFDVITFNESPDVLTRALMPASVENVAKARRFVEKVEASGGTNIDDALRAALDLVKDEPGKTKMIVFLTDGLPTVGETDINTILSHFKQKNGQTTRNDTSPALKPSGLKQAGLKPAGLKGKGEPNAVPPARLFCFGLGYDVNVPFLDRLAALGNGDSDYVRPEEDVEATVSAFFAKVASPILSNVRLAFDGMDVYDVYPKTLPDLFQGSQLVITGRFRGTGAGSVHLSGLASGSDANFTLGVKAGEADGSNNFLPRIWAARKLGYLVDQVRLSDNPAGKKEIIDEIVRLSREYGIITEYTSFLVDEQEIQRLSLRDTNGAFLNAGGVGEQKLSAESLEKVRNEVARRSRQFGVSGAGVTNQSGRANAFKKADQSASRYQSANGSVLYFADGSQNSPAGRANGLAAPGNYRYGGAPGAGGFPGSGGPSGFAGGGRGSKAEVTLKDVQDALKLQLADAGNTITVQAVNDRTFYLQSNNVWQDHSFDPKKQSVTRIQAFSEAHFALLKAVPALAAYSSVGDEVIIRVGSNAVQIGKDGKAKLTDAELKALTEK